MDIVPAPTSGDAETDALVEGPIWASTSLTFGFPTLASQFTGYSGGEPAVGFEALNAVQQAAVRAIFASISTFANLTFSEATGVDAGAAVLRFGMSDVPDTAHAYLPSATELGGDSWYNNATGDYDAPQIGNYAWLTFMHEIGHALGFGHPHEALPAMSLDRDWMPYTVMSYRSYTGGPLNTGYTNEEWGFAQSFMMEDIAGLQFLYGANFNHNASNSLYRWNPLTGEMSIDGIGQGVPGGNRVFLTVWDGGGTDTYDFSNYAPDPGGFSSGLTIDLRPGAWTILPPGQAPVLGAYSIGNIANAMLHNDDLRSAIENAVGTSGGDWVYGNQVANQLSGGAGGDRLEGYAGADTLFGDDGSDNLNGGDGNDILWGGEGGDTLVGESGDDWLDGQSGDDYLTAGPGNDTLYGSEGDDWLVGNEGTDTITGGVGSDNLEGRQDDDTLAGGDGDDSLWGGDGNDTLTAGSGNDWLHGDNGDDHLTGGDGDDQLSGGPGIDVLVGGLGNDTYWLDGVDQFVELAGEGIDTLYVGVDFVAPLHIENLTATGSAAISLTGNDAANYLMGSLGNDILDGRAGADTMSGNLGDDTYYVDDPGDYVLDGGMTAGNDIVFASTSYTLQDNLFSPSYENQIETLVLLGTADLSGAGNKTANTINGNSGSNILNGQLGTDTLFGSGGADELIGGADADVFLYLAASDSTAGQQDWLSDFEHGLDTIDLRAIEYSSVAYEVAGDSSSTRVTVVTAGPSLVLRVAGIASAADFLFGTLVVAEGYTLTGTAGNDALFGAGGADTLDGLAGDDYLDGGGAADNAKGGEGNNVYVVDQAGDVIVELAGGGFDRVYALASYGLGAGVEVEVIATGGPDANAAIGLSGNEFANNLWANQGDNALLGYGGIDSLFGYGGNDYLDGGVGADLLVGGLGDDIYVVDDLQDFIVEYAGEGQDKVYAMTGYTLSAGASIEILISGGPLIAGGRNLTGNELANNIWDDGGDNDLYGAGGNDALFGFAGVDYLDGGTGADFLVGGAGDDIMVVDNAGDVVVETGGEGSDTVYSSIDYTLATGQSIEIVAAGGADPNAALVLAGNELANNLWGNGGNNLLSGAGGDDAVFGFAGSDDLFGGDGSDLIAGGAGNDNLYGGNDADILLGDAGADSFVFNTAPGGGVDTIGDFSAADDLIALDDGVFAGLTPGALAAGAFVTGTAAGDADDRIVYDPATGALWFDADGNGAGAAVQFATLGGGPSIAASDFLIF